jgi:hypothetical protein
MATLRTNVNLIYISIMVVRRNDKIQTVGYGHNELTSHVFGMLSRARLLGVLTAPLVLRTMQTWPFRTTFHHRPLVTIH